MKIRKIRLRNFLSFGNAVQELELSKLNTIVGANNSGKTNVFRAIELAANLLSGQNTPSEPYYHNKNFERPIRIELDLDFDGEEREALMNLFACSCLYGRPGVQQGGAPRGGRKNSQKGTVR